LADYNELKTIIKALGFEVKKQQLMELMKEYDLDNEGRINFTDYTSLSNIGGLLWGFLLGCW